MRRRMLGLLGAAATAAASVAVLAGFAGGFTVVATHGSSMQPTYHAGDVVVVRDQPSYAVGDAVAYRSPLLDEVVLHRIVGTDGDGLLLQGDANDWLDPEQPTEDDLLGAAWLHVPKLGMLNGWVSRHRVLTGLAALAFLVATATTADRRRSTVTTARDMHRSFTAGRPLTAALLVGLVACGLLTALSWSRPVTAPGPVGYTHEGAFTYTARATRGVVYDSARVSTGDPLFLALVDDVRVGFAYRFAVDEAAVAGGTIGLSADVTNGSGWSRTVEVAPPEEFVGTEADIAGGLDIGSIRAMAAAVAQATGESGAIAITLRPTVSVTADVAGGTLEDDFSPSLAYHLTDTQLRVADSNDEEGEPLRATESGELLVPDRQPAVLAFAGREVAVSMARTLSLAMAVACALALVVALVSSRRTAELPDADRIARRWAGLLVQADTGGMQSDRVVHVADMVALAKLAQASNRLILHDRPRGVFLLDVDGTHYRHRPTGAFAGLPERRAPADHTAHA